MSNHYLREIKGVETRKWKPQKDSLTLKIIDDFLSADMEMAEVNLDRLPEPEQKAGSSVKSTKQDSFASSFYAWKRKKSSQDRLCHDNIDVLLIRRGNKVALKKTEKRKQS